MSDKFELPKFEPIKLPEIKPFKYEPLKLPEIKPLPKFEPIKLPEIKPLKFEPAIDMDKLQRDMDTLKKQMANDRENDRRMKENLDKSMKELDRKREEFKSWDENWRKNFKGKWGYDPNNRNETKEYNQKIRGATQNLADHRSRIESKGGRNWQQEISINSDGHVIADVTYTDEYGEHNHVTSKFNKSGKEIAHVTNHRSTLPDGQTRYHGEYAKMMGKKDGEFANWGTSLKDHLARNDPQFNSQSANRSSNTLSGIKQVLTSIASKFSRK